MNFFPEPRFLAKILLLCNDMTVIVFWPLRRGRRKEARESTPCRIQALVTFHHLVKQFAPGIVEVNGLDFEVREEGVFVEMHRATSVVSNMEPVCEELVVNIFGRFR